MIFVSKSAHSISVNSIQLYDFYNFFVSKSAHSISINIGLSVYSIDLYMERGWLFFGTI